MRKTTLGITNLLNDFSSGSVIKVSAILNGKHSLGGLPAIPNIEELYSSLPQTSRDNIEEILVHKTKIGIVQIEVKLDVEKEDCSWEESSIIVVLRPTEAYHHTALFRGPIRVIGDEKEATVNNICAAVFIRSKLLDGKTTNGIHQFLRLCEGPAHLKWDTSSGSGSRSSEYERPVVLARFVKQLVPKLVSAANAVTKNAPLGMGFITMPLNGSKKGASSSGGGGSGGGGGGGGLRRSVPELSVSKNKGATKFKFMSPESSFMNKEIKFESSYTVWSGSPWSKAAISEFKMTQTGGTHPITYSGCTISSAGKNAIVVKIDDPNSFELEISEFDERLERIHRFEWK